MSGEDRNSATMDDRRIILLLITALLLCCPRASGDRAVSAANQIPIMLKVLTYDRALIKGEQETIRIGVLYSPGSEASKNLCGEVEAAFKYHADKTINRLPFSFELLPLSSVDALDVAITHHGFDVFCIADEETKMLPGILNLSRRHGILTMSFEEAHVRDGVAMVIEVADGIPRIVINLEAVRAAGHDLRANLLHLCRVIK